MNLAKLNQAQQRQLARWLADQLPADLYSPELSDALPLVVELLPALIEQARLLLPPDEVVVAAEVVGVRDRRE